MSQARNFADLLASGNQIPGSKIANDSIASAHIQSNSVGSNELNLSDTYDFTNRLKSPYLIGSHNTDNSVYGFKRGANNSVGVSFPNNNANTKIYGLTFTIPTTPGVNHWTVYAHGTWTGAQPGHRLWGAMFLDATSPGGGGVNNNSESNNGYPESSWWESDLSVAAYTWQPSGTWTNVTAGSHEVELQAWSSASGGNAWRAGMAVLWWPAEGS